MSFGAVIAGGVSLVGASMASKSASKVQKGADAASMAQLQFAQQQYDDWKAIYGPLEQNLADYYSNLTPEYYEAIGLEAIESEYAAVNANIQRTLAQQGMSDSGAALALEQQSEIEQAQAKADIRRSSDSAVAAEQAGFLAQGQGTNPASSLLSTYTNIANQKANEASYANQAAGQAWGNAINVIGTGLSDWMNRS